MNHFRNKSHVVLHVDPVSVVRRSGVGRTIGLVCGESLCLPSKFSTKKGECIRWCVFYLFGYIHLFFVNSTNFTSKNFQGRVLVCTVYVGSKVSFIRLCLIDVEFICHPRTHHGRVLTDEKTVPTKECTIGSCVGCVGCTRTPSS